MTTDLNPVLFYLHMAYEVAAKESTDPSTQNGAVLVSEPCSEWYCAINENGQTEYLQRKPYREFIASANFFPHGVKESTERWDKSEKLLWVEHAERNVIYLAAKRGFKTEGTTMYVCWGICCDCARAVVQAGIKELVCHNALFHKEHTFWNKSIDVGMKILEEGGVKCSFYDGLIGGPKIRFKGQLVQP